MSLQSERKKNVKNMILRAEHNLQKNLHGHRYFPQSLAIRCKTNEKGWIQKNMEEQQSPEPREGSKRNARAEKKLTTDIPDIYQVNYWVTRKQKQKITDHDEIQSFCNFMPES